MDTKGNYYYFYTIIGLYQLGVGLGGLEDIIV